MLAQSVGLTSEIPISRTRRLIMPELARELRQRATPSEARILEALRGRRLAGARFRRQQPIGPYVVDFFCSAARLVVEIDGPIHAAHREYDEDRQQQLEAAGYRVLRFSDDYVMSELPSILEAIMAVLTPTSEGSPSPAHRAVGIEGPHGRPERGLGGEGTSMGSGGEGYVRYHGPTQ